MSLMAVMCLKEYLKETENDPTASNGLDVIQKYAFKHPPKKKVIILFNSEGSRVGCILNPD